MKHRARQNHDRGASINPDQVAGAPIPLKNVPLTTRQPAKSKVATGVSPLVRPPAGVLKGVQRVR